MTKSSNLFLVLFFCTTVATAKEPAIQGCADQIGSSFKKGIDKIAAGSMIEIIYKSEFHDHSVQIEAKYLGYLDGVIYKSLADDKIVYGTIPLADIIGQLKPLPSARARVLDRAIKWADLAIEKKLGDRYTEELLDLLREFYIKFGKIADIKGKNLVLKVAASTEAEFLEIRNALPSEFHDYKLEITPYYY